MKLRWWGGRREPEGKEKRSGKMGGKREDGRREKA
jgi:hypothetical protein